MDTHPHRLADLRVTIPSGRYHLADQLLQRLDSERHIAQHQIDGGPVLRRAMDGSGAELVVFATDPDADGSVFGALAAEMGTLGLRGVVTDESAATGAVRERQV